MAGSGAVSLVLGECAHVFHAAGARLVLCGRDAGRLQEVVQKLTAASSSHSKTKTYAPRTVTFDLAEAETVVRAAEEILQCYGQVDVLINNAGISYRGNILDTDLSVQRAVMDTNYFGPIALTQDAASKHATQAYFDCLRAEVEQYGLAVTVVSPGYIRTNLSLNA
ncbi:hypothetical protein CRUP_022887, partial [Coryphaenoides rupestris]